MSSSIRELTTCICKNKGTVQLCSNCTDNQHLYFPSMDSMMPFYSRTDISCTPDRNCHTFCLGDKIASHPGVLTQAKKNTQNLEINQILGVVVQEKESNMVFCSRWKFPTLGMTVLSGTSAEPRFRSARSSLGLETSI